MQGLKSYISRSCLCYIFAIGVILRNYPNKKSFYFYILHITGNPQGGPGNMRLFINHVPQGVCPVNVLKQEENFQATHK